MRALFIFGQAAAAAEPALPTATVGPVARGCGEFRSTVCGCQHRPQTEKCRESATAGERVDSRENEQQRAHNQKRVSYALSLLLSRFVLCIGIRRRIPSHSCWILFCGCLRSSSRGCRCTPRPHSHTHLARLRWWFMLSDCDASLSPLPSHTILLLLLLLFL